MSFGFPLSLFQILAFKFPLPAKGAHTKYVCILQRSCYVFMKHNTKNMKYPTESYNPKTKDNSKLGCPRRKKHNVVEQDEWQRGVKTFQTGKPIPGQYTTVKIHEYFCKDINLHGIPYR